MIYAVKVRQRDFVELVFYRGSYIVKRSTDSSSDRTLSEHSSLCECNFEECLIIWLCPIMHIMNRYHDDDDGITLSVSCLCVFLHVFN